MEAAERSSYIKLHTAVLLFGFTAILGRLIEITEGPLVWYRMGITALSLLLFPRLWKALKDLNRKTAFKIMGTGGIVMLHWVTFYGAIKFSNVSVALCMMATASFFTAFLEPLIFRRKPIFLEIALGLMILPGIYLVFQFSGTYLTGMIMGLISAFLAALFGTINKTFVVKTKPIVITFLELGMGFLFLSLLLPFYFEIRPDSSLLIENNMDWLWILILSLLCTTLAFNFAVDALKHLSAFTSALAINLEPIYGILLAIPIFGEQNELNVNFYIGAGLVIGAIFINGIVKARLRRKKKHIITP